MTQRLEILTVAYLPAHPLQICLTIGPVRSVALVRINSKRSIEAAYHYLLYLKHILLGLWQPQAALSRPILWPVRR